VVGERLAQAERLGEPLAGEIAPVVEVAGDDEGRAIGHLAVDALDERGHLVAATALVKRKVQAYAVQRRRESRNFHLTVEHSAALQVVRRDVLVLGTQDRVAAEDRVAVVSVVVDRVAPVRVVLPHRARQEFVLRLVGPLVEARRVAPVLSLHFLEKDDVCVEQSQVIAQLVDHQAAVELREPLVDVVRSDV